MTLECNDDVISPVTETTCRRTEKKTFTTVELRWEVATSSIDVSIHYCSEHYVLHCVMYYWVYYTQCITLCVVMCVN